MNKQVMVLVVVLCGSQLKTLIHSGEMCIAGQGVRLCKIKLDMFRFNCLKIKVLKNA